MAEQNTRRESLRDRGEPADVPEEDGDALLLPAERKLSGLLPIDDRAGDRWRDETTERDPRPRDGDLLFDQKVALQDDPPEDGGDDVGDRRYFDRPRPDDARCLDREEDVRADDVGDEESESADEAVQPPAQNEKKARERHHEELRQGGSVALLQDGIAVCEDRLRGVRPDLDAEHLAAARVRHGVAVGDSR